MNKPNLGEQIRKLRLSKKYTLAVMANRLGVTTSAVAAYENGSRNPSFDVLLKIARMFNVTADNLLGHSSKDYIDISGLCSAQRDSVESLVSTYRKFNALVAGMLGMEGGSERELAQAAEERFADSFEALEREIEDKKGQSKSKSPDAQKQTYENAQDGKEANVSENCEIKYLEARIKTLENIIKQKNGDA